MKLVRDVDSYIENAPKEVRGKLKELRVVIRKAVPSAEERISYGMPYYGYKGRLAYFGLSKNHIGLYIPPPIIEEHKEDLRNYGTSMSAVRFPLDEELPVSLIEKLVKARMKWNEEAKKK